MAVLVAELHADQPHVAADGLLELDRMTRLAQPRLGLLWFVPFGMFLTPGSGQPTPLQTSWTLFVALVTVGLAIRASRARFAARDTDPNVRALASPA